jgi:hypothetical protein
MLLQLLSLIYCLGTSGDNKFGEQPYIYQDVYSIIRYNELLSRVFGEYKQARMLELVILPNIGLLRSNVFINRLRRINEKIVAYMSICNIEVQ